MQTIRRWHAYLGLLIAPSVLFFSLTGAVQLFGLHESRGNYHPPVLIEKLSSVHKDQEFSLGHHGGPPPAAAVPDHHEQSEHLDDDAPALSTSLLKWYFLIVAMALTVSTGFGIWMGLKQLRRPVLAWTLLLSGALVPIALLIL
jgi:hypothetical protein